MNASLSHCHPTFIDEIQRLAALWRSYAAECQAADQSALLAEFQEWYRRDLAPAP
jgi:hypothetical protein